MNVSRWFSELARPSRKCWRVGHRTYTEKTRVYLWPSQSWNAVVDVAVEKQDRCSRCGKRIGPVRLERTGNLQGLTMDSSRWDTLREKGRLEQ